MKPNRFCIYLLVLAAALLLGQCHPAHAAGTIARTDWTQVNDGAFGMGAGGDSSYTSVVQVDSCALASANLAELLPGQNYITWYAGQVGATPHPTYFSAYALKAVGATLYVGFGTARPGENGHRGGLLAGTDGATLDALLTLTEEGFIDIEPAGSILYIPGPDPTDAATPPAHQWDWGNFYKYEPPGPGVKHRNLPKVIHAWGAWWDAASSQLYAAVSAHLGDYETWSGQVFRTEDLASGWNLVAGRDEGVGQYRTYDIVGFNGRLYVIWNDALSAPCGLAESSDNGVTWSRLTMPDIQCRSRLVVFADKLLALNLPQTGFVTVNTSGNVSTVAFSDFIVTDWAYNYATVDGANSLYVVTLDGRIMRTADLSTWQIMASTDLELITLGYWPAQNWLIAANRGDMARLWKVDLATATPITLLQPPASLRATINGDAIQLDWTNVIQDEQGNPATPASYRIYRSTDPYFTASSAQQIGTAFAAQLTDNNIGGNDVVGDVTKNYFYIVRAVDANGNLSRWSQRVGEFDFALTPGS